jgi:hypothetical protein
MKIYEYLIFSRKYDFLVSITKKIRFCISLQKIQDNKYK